MLIAILLACIARAYTFLLVKSLFLRARIDQVRRTVNRENENKTTLFFIRPINSTNKQVNHKKNRNT